MKVKLFICEEREVYTPISRHYLAPLALCREYRVVELQELEKILPKDYVDTVIARGQAIIKDSKLIKELTGVEAEATYIRIVKL